MHEGNEHQRILQKKLAEELTVFVHSKVDYEFAIKASSILFNNGTSKILSELNEEQLIQVMDGVPAIHFSRKALSGMDLVTFLAETKIFPSKGE